MKPILSIDFDGWIYPADPFDTQRNNEWPVDKPPIDGVFEYLRGVMEHFTVHVISWRTSHFEYRRWWKTFHWPCDKDGRPEGIHLRLHPEVGSFVYLATRAVPLSAQCPPPLELTKFKPYAIEET